MADFWNLLHILKIFFLMKEKAQYRVDKEWSRYYLYRKTGGVHGTSGIR